MFAGTVRGTTWSSVPFTQTRQSCSTRNSCYKTYRTVNGKTMKRLQRLPDDRSPFNRLIRVDSHQSDIDGLSYGWVIRIKVPKIPLNNSRQTLVIGELLLLCLLTPIGRNCCHNHLVDIQNQTVCI